MSLLWPRRALLSVTDKSGIVEFARALAAGGTEILSTGGTAKILADNGVAVTRIDHWTGSPEMLNGRVKTLHPKVFGGILALRDRPEHCAEVEQYGLGWIDVVVVNLYDFKTAARNQTDDFSAVIEQIDIGGPSLLRAAAKNHVDVLPLVDPADYAWVTEYLRTSKLIPHEERRKLAAKVFQHTAAYDQAISQFLEQKSTHTLTLEPIQDLRYGENPHQSAKWLRPQGQIAGLAKVKILQGKALSYNNLLDLDSGLGLVADLGPNAVAYIKHNNPCGAAIAPHVIDAAQKARQADAVSAFGAVVVVNAGIDAELAHFLTESFLEVVLAQHVTDAAAQVFAAKKNLRVLSLEDVDSWTCGKAAAGTNDVLRQIRGGFLMQSADDSAVAAELETARVVSRRVPSVAERAALGFAWTVAKHVRSNAIVYAREGQTVAIGAGQMSRVDSVAICRLKAGSLLHGTVVASDAFFPFRDAVDLIAETGATAIIHPGGSVRDDEVVAAADAHGLAMLCTGVRHFRH